MCSAPRAFERRLTVERTRDGIAAGDADGGALGADLVVDSRCSGAVQAMRQFVPRGCDALLDLIDHNTQHASAAFLARWGRLVTLRSVVDHGAYVDRRITAWRVDMHPDGKT